MDDVRRLYDGYDTGVRYADDQVGRLLGRSTTSACRRDRGAGLVRPRREPRRAGHLLRPPDGRRVHHPAARWSWPGRESGLAARLGRHRPPLPVRRVGDAGRPGRRRGAPALGRAVVRRRPAVRRGPPVGTTSCCPTGPGPRSARSGSGRWLCIRTYHDAFHGFPDVLLFDVEADPFEQHDRAADRPEVVEHALAVLADWASDALARSPPRDRPAVVGPDRWRPVAQSGRRALVPGPPAGHRPGRWAERFDERGWPGPDGSRYASGDGPPVLEA